jgi:hypothetical protein
LFTSSNFWFMFFIDNISIYFFNLVYIIVFLLSQGSCSSFFTLHLSSFLCFYSKILFLFSLILFLVFNNFLFLWFL